MNKNLNQGLNQHLNHRLSTWLSYIESLHPKNIMMGLDRVDEMVRRLKLAPQFKIIVVAGTNGKGSTTAMLEKIYSQAGYQVGCYTSPHLLRYNERLRVNHQEVPDAALCAAFAAVEQARIGFDAPIALTYFEFGTLAAVWHLSQISIDIAILEIGLGGRLDAVNAFEADCAIVTNVDLDHQDYLGDTREKIGYEKAGVYRANKPAICGDASPPESLIAHAKKIGAHFLAIQHAFNITANQENWQYQLKKPNRADIDYLLPYPALIGTYQVNNAACAMTAVACLQADLPVDLLSIKVALQNVTLPGRFEVLRVPIEKALPTCATVILDVAHNPHAASALADNLKKIQLPKPAKIIAVFAMLSDKDIAGVVDALKAVIDCWYVADINQARGAKAADIAKIIARIVPDALVQCFADATLAYKQALLENQFYKADNENDKIVVFGSFYTVANVKQTLAN